MTNILQYFQDISTHELEKLDLDNLRYQHSPTMICGRLFDNLSAPQHSTMLHKTI